MYVYMYMYVHACTCTCVCACVEAYNVLHVSIVTGTGGPKAYKRGYYFLVVLISEAGTTVSNQTVAK